jgi:hypothetical protein
MTDSNVGTVELAADMAWGAIKHYYQSHGVDIPVTIDQVRDTADDLVRDGGDVLKAAQSIVWQLCGADVARNANYNFH